MNTALEQLVASAKQAVENMYATAESDFELMPMYSLAKDGEITHVVALAGLPDDSASKNQIVFELRAFADQQGSNGWTFVSEGWTLPQERLKGYAGGMRFADQPDRIEMVTVQAGVATGHMAVLNAYITRQPECPPQLEWQPLTVNGEDNVSVRSRWNIYDMQVPGSAKLAAIQAEAAS